MLLTTGGLIVKKQEMTRIWSEDKMLAVTLLKVVPQKVLRHKTLEKDGYVAIVVGGDEKRTGKFGYSAEYKISEDDLSKYPVGSDVTGSVLAERESVRVVGISKGKGFQGGMKRFNFGGGPATHGSKFHRALGSTGNRKPRRTHKGKKMAGHMGSEKKVLKSVPVVDVIQVESESFVVLKGSVPGAYNTYLELILV